MRALELLWPRRLAAVGGMCAAMILAGPPAAFAHVSVTPGSVVPGESATIAFHVPNERADASTVRLEVLFPADRPFAAAAPRALSGWTVTVTRRAVDEPVDTAHGLAGEVVASVVWEGGQISPGTYQEFPVFVPAMPDEPGTLTFKALQTYSTGEVARWIDTTEEGLPEPEHPAPTVTVAQPPAAAEQSTSDTTARVLGGAGLAAGLAATGVAALGRRRRGTPAPVAGVVRVRERARS